MALNIENIIAEIKEASILELNDLVKAIEEEFPKFLDENINNLDAEYLVPDIISKQINDKTATVYIKGTTAKWHGVTYKKDKEDLVNAINIYINEEKYPRYLWK